MRILRKLVVGFMAGMAMMPAISTSAAVITINASQTNQVIEGFGANINHRSWTNDDLKPVIDGLINQGGMNLFRVVFDRADWEGTNDNNDSGVMNWDYYNTLYSSPRFQPLWGLISYLNQQGVSNGIVLNFQGTGPSWMGGSSLTPGMEDEWAEMIASLLVYARNTLQLQFNLVAPENEPDNSPQGIGVSSASQYVTMLHSLAQKLDTNGLSDIRLVGPDMAFSPGFTNYMARMMTDPLVMSKLAHFGVHSYSSTGSDVADSFISHSGYPNTTFWMTEFNVNCPSCESGQSGDNDWSYCRGTAQYLCSHLANGASAGLVWEGYDSIYTIFSPRWSFWGLYAVDDTNATLRTYTPRKSFYTFSQFSKFIPPGAQNITIGGGTGSLQMLAFYHAGTGQFTIVGINPQGTPGSVDAVLASLPPLDSLELYYTDSDVDLADAGPVTVTDNSFSADVPSDCVFTITGFATLPPPPPPPVLQYAWQSGTLALSWTDSSYLLETCGDMASSSVWSTVTNAPQTNGGTLNVVITPADTQAFFRLRRP